MSLDWFRSWHGAPTDTKWLLIGRKAGVAPGIVSAVVWALLDHASQGEQRGSIEGFDIETYSTFSGFAEEQIGAVIKALQDKDLIVENVFKAWVRRQPKKEDNGAAERKRKQREKEDVTPCHAPSHDVTTDKEERREEKIKKEKDLPSGRSKKPRKKKSAEKPEDVSEEVWNDFLNLRKEKKSPVTQTAINRIRTEAEKARLSLNAALTECCARGWQGFNAKWIEKEGKINATSGRNLTVAERLEIAGNEAIEQDLADFRARTQQAPAAIEGPNYSKLSNF